MRNGLETNTVKLVPTYEGKYKRPPNTYSRRHVAALLNVSQSYVFRTVDGHGITPKHEGPRVYYDRAEVDAYVKTFNRRRALTRPRKTSVSERRERGELAAKAFVLFAQGKTMAEIVIATEGDPATVRELWQEYNTSFEEGLAKKRRAEREELQRRELAQLERQRKREEHFASVRGIPAPSVVPTVRREARFVPVRPTISNAPVSDAGASAPPRSRGPDSEGVGDPL